MDSWGLLTSTVAEPRTTRHTCLGHSLIWSTEAHVNDNARITLTSTLAAVALFTSTARAWDIELTPSPPITTSIDTGPTPLRTQVNKIRLTTPVLKNALDKANAYWESRVEYKG